MRGFEKTVAALTASGFSIEQHDGPKVVLRPHIPDSGHAAVHPLSTGAFLVFNEVRASRWPAAPASLAGRRLLLNYCIEGRCEMDLDDGMRFFMEPEHLALGTCHAMGEFLYPSSRYDGIEMVFDIDALENDRGSLLREFEVDIPALIDMYDANRHIHVSQADGSLKRALEQLWSVRDSGNLPLLKCLSLNVLIGLPAYAAGSKDEGHTHYLTSMQVSLARHAAEAIEEELGSKLTVSLLAQRAGICETSLKEYFKGVYGENISDFVRRKRMERAARLLEATDERKVYSIADEVGYGSQGKFAAAFKRQFGLSPLDYRRGKRIEADGRF